MAKCLCISNHSPVLDKHHRRLDAYIREGAAGFVMKVFNLISNHNPVVGFRQEPTYFGKLAVSSLIFKGITVYNCPMSFLSLTIINTNHSKHSR